MTAENLLLISLVLGMLGLGLWAAALFWQLWRGARAASRIEQALQNREAGAAGGAAANVPGRPGAPPPWNTARDQQLLNPPAAPPAGQNAATAAAGAISAQQLAASLQEPAWLQSGLARALLANEDRKLLDQAGIALRAGGTLYVASRAALAIALPLLGLLLPGSGGDTRALATGFLGFGLGLMLPKWIVRAKAARRREQVVEELPLFVDLLRLLQGVGLSIDQSLQVLASEFGSVLRVLSGELALANRLYVSGRTREQSFQRLAHLSADDDMTAVVSLLVQVDRHGGAVQEPLGQFSARLREKRQASFKEKIGKITVKMTGVMVLTLLPALLVITAGPGFMAVIRSLSRLGGN